MFEHCLVNDLEVPQSLITPLCKAMNHNSNDVKLLVAIVSSHLAKLSKTTLPEPLLKALMPMLVNGTKEKNSTVKSTSESALVEVLRMREDKEAVTKCLNLLDSGARDALEDVISKVLHKLAKQPHQGRDEGIDNTILTI